jgi:hypothetical protein
MLWGWQARGIDTKGDIHEFYGSVNGRRCGWSSEEGAEKYAIDCMKEKTEELRRIDTVGVVKSVREFVL